MSRGINKVILIGNLGRDPETRYSAAGNAVTNLNIATSESWTDSTGNRQDRTEWHRVVLFGKVAEIANQYLRKGSKVYIEGSLRTSQYEKDGVTRYTTDIIAREMSMLDSRQDQTSSGSAYSPPQQQQAPQQAPANPPSAPSAKHPDQKNPGQHQSQDHAVPDFTQFDDDIPF